MPPAALFPLLLPLLLVTVGGLAVLGAEPFLTRASKHAWLPWIAVVILLGAGLVQAAAGCTGSFGSIYGIFAMDQVRLWLCLAVILSAAIGMAGLQQTLSRDDYAGGEPYALALFASAGAMMMVMATDFLALFVALEITSLSVYALVGLRRTRAESNEALFKYFVMGSIFSAILLYGIALTYGATGYTQMGHPALDGRVDLLLFGQTLVVVGLLFKVGAVPFHFWTPDAYTGAPAVVTGLMGSIFKIGGFAALGALWLNLVAATSGSPPSLPLALNASVPITEGARQLHSFQLTFLLLGLVSLMWGNFAALRQTSSRRMVAYSSIAHAGYMLLAFALPHIGYSLNLGCLWFYLIGYSVAISGALTALAMMAGPEDANDTLGGIAGQGRVMPLQGFVLTVFMASFAGIPPTMGFLGKYLVFQDLVFKGWSIIAIFAMLMAIVGAAYYLRLVVAIWASPAKEPARTGTTVLSSWAVAVAAAASIVLIAWPNTVYQIPAPPAHADAVSAVAPAPAP